MSLDRRALLRGIAALSLPCAFSTSVLSLTGCTSTPNANPSATPSVSWADADKIVAAIPEPNFTDQTFDIRNFGAKPGKD